MVFLLVLVIAAVIVFALYRWLATGPPSRRSAGSVIGIGLALGAARAAVSGLGFYSVEHSGGPLQAPAYAMAMAGWPELALLGPHRGRARPALYGKMALLLITTTTAFVVVIAFTARRRVGPGG
jgi:hypothetical protein